MMVRRCMSGTSSPSAAAIVIGDAFAGLAARMGATEKALADATRAATVMRSISCTREMREKISVLFDILIESPIRILDFPLKANLQKSKYSHPSITQKYSARTAQGFCLSPCALCIKLVLGQWVSDHRRARARGRRSGARVDTCAARA